MEQSNATRDRITVTLTRNEAAELVMVLEELDTLPGVVTQLLAMLDMPCEED